MKTQVSKRRDAAKQIYLSLPALEANREGFRSLSCVCIRNDTLFFCTLQLHPHKKSKREINK